MSIASRITEIETHLTNDYGVLTIAGADLNGVNKNIENLTPTWQERLLYFMNNGTSVVWNNWNKVSGTGTSVSINGTVEAPMSIEYKGNTSQSGTPTPSSPQDIHTVNGNNTITVSNSDNTQSSSCPINLGVENLLEPTLTNTQKNGLTFFVYEDGSIKVSGTATATTYYNLTKQTLKAGTYTLSGGVNSNCKIISKYGASYQTSQGAGTTFTLTEETTPTEFYIQITNGTAIATPIIFYPMIEKGNTQHQYTPYGKAIELNKISTYQDYIRKSTGKNICESSAKLNNTTIAFYLTKQIEKTFTISFNTNETLNSNSIYFVVDGTTKSIGTISGTGTILRTYTISDEIYTAIQNATTFDLRIYKSGASFNAPGQAIIVNGTESTLEYEPYGTSWYKYGAIGKVVLNGSGSGWYKVGNAFQNQNTSADITTLLANNSTGAYNDKYKFEYWQSGITTNLSNYAFGWNTNNYITIRNDNYSTVSDFTTELNNNPLTFYIPLKTPTYTEITDTTLINQLEALKKSYESQTNISQTNNDLPFELSVTALGEM